MKVAIDDEFAGVTCEAYEALYFDEAFNLAMGEALELGRVLLRLDRSNDRIVRHVCYEPKRDPRTLVGQAEGSPKRGSSRASFIEELDYDRRSRRGRWRTIPNLFPDRVRNSGTLEIIEIPTGVRRSVRGDVEVSLFGFGRILERMIVAEIVKSYAITAQLTRAWLARPPG